MKSRFLLPLISAAFLALSTGGSQEPLVDSGLTAHEWGTFTSIAGARGEAVVWMPQAERDDLPASSNTSRTIASRAAYRAQFEWKRRSSIFTLQTP